MEKQQLAILTNVIHNLRKMNRLKIYLTACSLAALPSIVSAEEVTTAINTSNVYSPVAVQDNITVTGKVTDENGNPLTGVTVLQKGTENSTISDTNGDFSIEASDDGVLVFSLVGYSVQTISISGNTSVGNISLSKLIHTAFKDEKADEILGGVSSVNIENIIDENYFTYTLDNLYTFVSGYNGNSLWGYGDAFALVDGVPRDLDNVMPSEIESITFLKGAQAVALYGSRGAKGAIIITTKRGKEQDMKISARVNTGVYVDKSYPEYLGAAEYMTYYNQARKNDGLDPLYSEELIYKTSTGDNPYRYPDVNFYSSDYIRKFSNRTDVTAEINGGNKFARYYSNVSYFSANNTLQFGEGEKLGSDRFNIRGNVDMNFNDYISAAVDANITMYNSKGYVVNGSDFWRAASTWRPNRVAPLIPTSYINEYATTAQDLIALEENIYNGQFLAGSSTDQTNVFADLLYAGKTKATTRQFQFDLRLDFKLSQLLDGLSFHTQASMDYNTAYNTSFNDKYAVYAPEWTNVNGKDEIINLTKIGENKHSGVQNISARYNNRTTAFFAHFDYNRVFGSHTVNAMLLANGFQIEKSGEYHHIANANLGLDIHYDLGKRYFAAFTAAMPYSAKLQEGSRAGFSPSVSLGWNISNEDFFNKGLINNLMLSVSASDLSQDIDISDYYMYLGAYSTGGWVSWGNSGSQVGFQSKNAGNPDFGYIHRKELSANMRLGMMNNSLTFDFSAFTNLTTGLIYQPAGSFPSYFNYNGNNFIPNINFNEDLRRGFDVSVNYRKTFGEVKFAAGANFTYINAKANKRDDSGYQYEYQYREGTNLNAIWGYECLGFFTDETDIANSPDQSSFGAQIKPGDLKYKDQNGDNVIDSKDVVDLKEVNGWQFGAPYTMGINLSASYKGFTLYVLGIAQTGFSSVYNSSYYWPAGDDKYSVNVRNAWTPETAATAEIPRLTTGSANNNNQTSDFWMKKISRFDLTRVQLTYDLPSTLFQNNRVLSGVSVYVSGSNLATISKESEKITLNIGSPAQTRFYNLGVKVNF